MQSRASDDMDDDVVTVSVDELEIVADAPTPPAVEEHDPFPLSRRRPRPPPLPVTPATGSRPAAARHGVPARSRGVTADRRPGRNPPAPRRAAPAARARSAPVATPAPARAPAPRGLGLRACVALAILVFGAAWSGTRFAAATPAPGAGGEQRADDACRCPAP